MAALVRASLASPRLDVTERSTAETQDAVQVVRTKQAALIGKTSTP